MNKAISITPAAARLAVFLVSCCLMGCSTKEPETPTAEKTPNASQAGDRDSEPPASEPAEEPAAKPDESPGLAVGEKAPPFELKDQNGELRSLADILKSGPAALVFYRSADW